MAWILSCQPPAPSDERFLAARAPVAERLEALFESNQSMIAPNPEGSGGTTRAVFIGDAPDPAAFAEVGKAELPSPTAKLASCARDTRAALSAFAAIKGEALGEGRMGGRGLDEQQRYEEVLRQLNSIRAAYCQWRDASTTCQAEMTASGRTAPAKFAPRFLRCD